MSRSTGVRHRETKIAPLGILSSACIPSYQQTSPTTWSRPMRHHGTSALPRTSAMGRSTRGSEKKWSFVPGTGLAVGRRRPSLAQLPAGIRRTLFAFSSTNSTPSSSSSFHTSFKAKRWRPQAHPAVDAAGDQQAFFIIPLATHQANHPHIHPTDESSGPAQILRVASRLNITPRGAMWRPYSRDTTYPQYWYVYEYIPNFPAISKPLP